MENKKKTVLITVFIVAVVAVMSFWFVGNREARKKELSNSALLGFEAIEQPDSDKDGLKDWEEELWGTNPKEKDTDSDGATDGEEVSLLRDPRVPGPNDSLQEPEQRYASLLKNVTEEKKAPVAEFGQSAVFIPYDENQLKISLEENTDIIKTYGLQMAKALSPLSDNEERQNEVSVMLSVLNTQEEVLLSVIQDSINDYSQVEKDILSIVVPNNAVPIHLNIVNSVRGIEFLLLNMKNVLNEPIVALQSAEVYSPTLNAFYSSIAVLNTYFEASGVSFSENEKIKININD